MHRLLLRQLKRIMPELTDPAARTALPPQYARLLELISDAYVQFDEEREFLDRTLELSSQELMARNELMRAMFLALPDVFILVDAADTVKDCRGALDSMFGLVPAEILNTPLSDLQAIITTEAYSWGQAELQRTTHAEVFYQLETTDETRYFEARFVPLHDSMSLIMIRDISEQAKAEEALRGIQDRLDHIIEFLPDATLVVDREHRVIAWNRAMEDMTGVAKKDILGQGDFAYGTPFYGHPRPILLDFIGKDPTQDYPMYRQVENSAHSLATEVFVPALNNGHGAYVWAKATPLYDRHNKVTGAIQTVRDTTDRHRSELISQILYLVSTVASASMADAELFASVFNILHENLKIRFMFVYRQLQSGEVLTYPFFDTPSQETRKLQPLLSGMAQNICYAGDARLQPIPPEAGASPNELWFAAPLRLGPLELGAVLIALPETPRRFTRADTPMLATIAEHLGSGIRRFLTETALRSSEEKHRSIFENATEGMFQISLDHDLLSANPAMARIFGYDSVESLMAASRDFLRNILTTQHRVNLLEMVRAHGCIENFQATVTRSDGSTVNVAINMRAVRHAENSALYLEGSMTDISMRKETERKLAIQTALFQQLFDNSPQGILLLGQEGTPIDLNPGFTDMFGYTRDDLQELFELLLPPDSLQESFDFIATVLGGTPISAETERVASDGRLIPVSMLGYPYAEDHTITGAFFIFNDISERKEYEKELTRQALRDNLTGLPNRVLFMDRLTQAMERQNRKSSYRIAVLMIDLDGFKRVNDTQGHQAGDALLQEISRRLSGCLRSTDTVARMGGDEFAVLVEDFRFNHEAITITRRILSSVRDPITIQGREVLVSASVGLVLHTAHYTSPNELLRDADISMYRSKELGKNQFKVFTKRMYEQVVQAVQLEHDLRRALESDEFELYLQPIFSAPGTTLHGFEGLLRWRHVERGLLAPGHFMEVAEETGLVTDIGVWVIRKGFQIMSGWLKKYPDLNIAISINLSPKDLIQPNLISMLTELLAESGIRSDHIKLEITETAVMNNPDLATSKLERLQKLGFKIAMDDFGTGYSSLSYLQRLPIDILKIDRSFVQTMQENANNLEIIRAIVGLGRILNLHIVAEGVETEDQLRTLNELGCDMAQGYLLGKPMPVDQAEELIRRQSPLPDAQ